MILRTKLGSFPFSNSEKSGNILVCAAMLSDNFNPCLEKYQFVMRCLLNTNWLWAIRF